MAKAYYRPSSFKINTFPQFISQLAEPMSIVIHAIDLMCWVAGSVFMMGAVLRYLEHRRNPSQSPLSQVLFLMAIGAALLLLPLVGQYALPHA